LDLFESQFDLEKTKLDIVFDHLFLLKFDSQPLSDKRGLPMAGHLGTESGIESKRKNAWRPQPSCRYYNSLKTSRQESKHELIEMLQVWKKNSQIDHGVRKLRS